MTSYYQYSRQVQSKNGTITLDNEQNIEYKNNKGRVVKKSKGKVVEDKAIEKKDFDRYLHNIDHRLFITPDIFHNAIRDLLSFDINASTKSNNSVPSDLEPGSKLTRKEKSQCNEIIRSFGLDPKKATKENIEELYNSLIDIYTEECEKAELANKQKKACMEKLATLRKNIDRFNDPDNNCY